MSDSEQGMMYVMYVLDPSRTHVPVNLVYDSGALIDHKIMYLNQG